MVGHMCYGRNRQRLYFMHDFPEDDRLPRKTRQQQVRRWDFLHQMEWVPVGSGSHSRLPARAVPGGKQGKTILYIGRAQHRGSITPGYVNPAGTQCVLPWGGKMHKKKEFEVLCTEGDFFPCIDSTTLLNATPAGVSEEGEPLYIGRVQHCGQLITGKVQRSHQVCYIPYDGNELNFKDYEVFIRSSIDRPSKCQKLNEGSRPVMAV
ncbi:uncharacterized protein LOC128273461 [Anopheles cruzii]|uniref:uncharacterized protein LOC128273461 n=1 Tax=Anopheles cruzii TaxID=68878 RepID=UPI0022EC4354|nr:uncharacterized protein LOC128273461 [Anopheles cruzii]